MPPSISIEGPRSLKHAHSSVGNDRVRMGGSRGNGGGNRGSARRYRRIRPSSSVFHRATNPGGDAILQYRMPRRTLTRTQTVITATAQLPPTRVAVHRRTTFFVGLPGAMLILVIVGFARTFYRRPFFGAVDGVTRSTALPLHLLVHGIITTGWFALLLTQTLLIAKRMVTLHRRFGIAGATLALLVIGMGLFTVVEFLTRRDASGLTIGVPQHRVVIGDTLIMLTYFRLTVGAGLYLRRNLEAHKRLMLLSGG